MAKAKNTKEITLDNILFNCRNILRGKIEQADRKSVV